MCRRPAPRSRESAVPNMHEHEVYALLWVTRACEARIRDLLVERCQIPEDAVQRDLHLTVYHARRRLPGVTPISTPVRVFVNTAETRFMVLAPGGENPRPGLIPGHRSVGIRLTKRNLAIEGIQSLRRSVYRFETPSILGRRHPTTDWRSAFGARHYQPHVKLLKPGSRIGDDLTILGRAFREELERIEFGRFEIRLRSRNPS